MRLVSPYLPDSGFDTDGAVWPRDLTVLEPPLPIKRMVYRCDSSFHLDDVLPLYSDHDAYGLILIQGQRATFYLVTAVDEQRIATVERRLQKQHSMGGQSQNRISRLRDESIAVYLEALRERAAALWLSHCRPTIVGLILAGHGDKKDQLLRRLDTPLRDAVIGVLTCDERVDASALRQRFVPLLDHRALEAQSAALQRFDAALVLSPDNLVFGLEEVIDALEQGLLREVFASEEAAAGLAAVVEEMGGNLSIICGRDTASEVFLRDYGPACGLRWF